MFIAPYIFLSLPLEKRDEVLAEVKLFLAIRIFILEKEYKGFSIAFPSYFLLPAQSSALKRLVKITKFYELCFWNPWIVIWIVIQA